MLNVVILSVAMLSVIMPNVVAPVEHGLTFIRLLTNFFARGRYQDSDQGSLSRLFFIKTPLT